MARAVTLVIALVALWTSIQGSLAFQFQIDKLFGVDHPQFNQHGQNVSKSRPSVRASEGGTGNGDSRYVVHLREPVVSGKIDIRPPATGESTLGKKKTSYSQIGQDLLLMPLFAHLERSGGFFVESGAFNGVKNSNTLLYELRGWRGLLIEPVPSSFESLVHKNRKAYAFEGCLSTTGETQRVHISAGKHRQRSHITSQQENNGISSGDSVVTGVPLLRLLRQLKQSTVDFWSLDVEGAEPGILNATDFNAIEIGVVMIEINHSKRNNVQISEVMKNAGFKDIGASNGRYPTFTNSQLDRIFVNPKYFEKRGVPVPTESSLDRGIVEKLRGRHH